MWAIGIRYLTGSAVATDTGDREQAEWPPHPARLFMALAAAHFELRGNQAQRLALEWLEKQGPPIIWAPPALVRTVVTSFVPVNDSRGLNALPQKRPRQARTFPTAIPASDTLFYVWMNSVLDEHGPAIEELAANVTRIGHSSSLVQAWIEFDERRINSSCQGLEGWISTPDTLPTAKMRVSGEGTLAGLEVSYNGDAIAHYAELQNAIATAKGTKKSALRAELKERFAGRMPTTQRPEISTVSGYSRVGVPSSAAGISETVFDNNLLILAHLDGPVLGLESTLQLSTAIRGTVFSHFRAVSDIPEWLSGHQSDGKHSLQAHVAIVPLPFIGHKHADGHLLGAALVFPRSVPRRERAQVLGEIFFRPDGVSKNLELRLGNLGTCTLSPETRVAPPIALAAENWTRPSRFWSSATPVVLDRYPKCDRNTAASEWLTEVSEIIARCCRNIGLPDPAEIGISKNAYHGGALRASPNGGGFPMFPNRNGGGARFQTHVLLAFDEPVKGPVLLGAGRYLGYGLCKPISLKGRP